jgi:uncharacterized RDD family membrane protein YckC
MQPPVVGPDASWPGLSLHSGQTLAGPDFGANTPMFHWCYVRGVRNVPLAVFVLMNLLLVGTLGSTVGHRLLGIRVVRIGGAGAGLSSR